MFLKLMDANADTIETHFALGALYRRRGEVERAIRIHQNLLARDALAPEHREQALLALAQDYLRAGLLDRAEGLFQQVSEVPRLRASALDALRGVYERQHEWQQALDTYRQLARIKAAPPRTGRGALSVRAGRARDRARRHRRLRARCCARRAREAAPFPRAALLRAQIAERQTQPELAVRLLRQRACTSRPSCCRRSCRICSSWRAASSAMRARRTRGAGASRADVGELKRLVFAAIAAGSGPAPRRCAPRIEKVFSQDADAAGASGRRAGGDDERVAHEIGALLAHAERYRCNECGFSGRSFYWHCPAVSPGRAFEAYAHRQTALTELSDGDRKSVMISMPIKSVKTCRISGGRPRHAIPARHQGEPEGNAARSSTSRSSSTRWTRRCPRAPTRWSSSPAAPSAPSRITSTRNPELESVLQRRASRNCWTRCAASCRAGPRASTSASRRRSGWATRCCARGRWSAMRPSWCISPTT